MEKIFTPEFIPYYIEEVEAFSLTPTEGLLYGFIRFYNKRENLGFYFTSEQLAEIIKTTSNMINKSLTNLEQKGLIERQTTRYAGGSKRLIRLSDTLPNSKTTPYQMVNDTLPNGKIKEEYIKENNKKEIIYKGQNDFCYKIAENFLEAHIKNESPGVLYKLKIKPREEILKSFAGGVEKLKRIDNFTEEQISFIINYLIENNKIDKPGEKFYWLDQIQTIDKLREKNKEKIPYFIVLIDSAKKHFISKKIVWTLEI